MSDVTRDAPQRPLAPIDPDVKIPDNVRLAKERAENYYKKQPATQEAPQTVQAEPGAPEPEVLPEPPKRKPGRPRKPVELVAQTQEETPEPQATPRDQTVAPSPDGVNWEHRYLSMKGRYDAIQQTVGSMQEQMAQMGDELMRSQQILQQRGAPAPQPTTKKLLTQDDEQTYGQDLIDFTRRAAQEVIAPQLEASQQKIQSLEQRLARDAQVNVQRTLDQEVPDWREINLDDRFKSWLRLPNIYSGRVRHQMLRDAYQAANAPLVVQFFRDFIADEEATGNSLPPSAAEQPVVVPRKAATSLAVLAAPGKAKPAGGDTAVPADKPRYTRLQVKRFYDAVRAGAFLGREAEKDRQENEIFLAQREGRVS